MNCWAMWKLYTEDSLKKHEHVSILRGVFKSWECRYEN